MEQRTSDAPIGAILTAFGGALLVVGSIMPWEKVSLDFTALADALGFDPSVFAGAGAGGASTTIAGTTATEGKVVLACGALSIAIAVAAYLRRELWIYMGIGAIVLGLIGGGYAIYDIMNKANAISDLKDSVAPTLTSVGVTPSILDDVIKLTLGIGIWLSVAGGAVILIGGLLLIAKRSALPPSMAGTGFGPSAYTPPDSGFTPPGASPVDPASPASDAPPPPPPPPESATGTGTLEGGEITPPQV